MPPYAKLINRDDWEFEFGQRDIHPALMTDLWLRAIRDRMPHELRLPVKAPEYLFTSTYKGYIKSADKKEILDTFIEAIKNAEYLYYVFSRTMGVIEEFGRLVDSVSASVTEEISKEDSAQKWELIEEKYLEMVPWFYIPWYLTEENILSDKVKNGLEKHRETIEKITDLPTALGVLLFPVKEATFQREQRDFVDIVKSASDTNLYEEKIERYLAHYSWMKTYFLLPIEPLSRQELLERLEESSKSNLVEEYNLQQQKKQEFQGMAASLLECVKDDEILMEAIENARELGWLLTASIEEGIYASAKLLPFLKILANKLAIPYPHLIHLTSEEISPLLRGTLDASTINFEERIVATAAWMQGGKIWWMWAKEAKEFTHWIESGVGIIDTGITEFKGQIAYKGKVTGKVRIALTPDQAKELMAGEILVTSMTSPDYVPAMRKAIAIVTNEGGLLSHAAIMSREFGKPCIVGTKIATRILSTGDTIEVDADRATIRILEKVLSE